MDIYESSRKQYEDIIIINEFFLKATTSGQYFTIYRIDESSNFEYINTIAATSQNFLSSQDIYEYFVEQNLIHHMSTVQNFTVGQYSDFNQVYTTAYLVREIKPIYKITYRLLLEKYSLKAEKSTFNLVKVLPGDEVFIKKIVLAQFDFAQYLNKLLHELRTIHPNKLVSIESYELIKKEDQDNYIEFTIIVQ